MISLTDIKVEATLLLNNNISDFNKLVDTINNVTYTSLDTNTPIVRFRGTSIKKEHDKILIVGWQRNVSRLQKLDVSLPTVISIQLSLDLIIEDISLDSDFKGSKGLTCHQGYLSKNLKENLLGKKFDSTLYEDIQTSKLHCFHLMEVLAGTLSAHELMVSKNKDVIFEEEALDCQFIGKDYLVVGKQYVDIIDKTFSFTTKFKDARDKFYIDTNGVLLIKEKAIASFYIEDEELFSLDFSAKNQREFCIKAKRLCLGGIKEIQKKYFRDFDSKIMFTNLYVPAYIGLLIQSFSMKLYHNNLNQVLHSLNTVQRYNNIPKCVGAVLNHKEAEEHFPNFDLNELFG